LPEPAGPVISTRLLVGAILSIIWRSCEAADDTPTNSASSPARSFNSCTSRRSRAASSARSATCTSLSALNGFSMKS
jgi:hypothetical protein